MKDWSGVTYASIPEGMTRDAIATINDFLHQLSPSIGRITRGQLPNSSGGPLAPPVDVSDFFYKPGIIGGQIGHGGKAAGDNLTLKSTAHSTKGFIYLGAAGGFAYDETNERVGLNVATPTAKLHMQVAAPVGQFIRPTTPVSNVAAIIWTDQSGSSSDANLIAGVSKASDNDALYIKHTRQLGTITFGGTTASDPLVSTGHILRVRLRVPVDTPSNPNDYVLVDLLQGVSTIVSLHFPSDGTGVHTGFPVTSPAALDATSSFVTYEYTLSGAQADAITDYTDINFGMTYYVGFDGGSEIQVAEIELELPGVGGGSAETLQTWQTPSYDNSLDFTADGAGSTTLDLTLSGDAPLRVSSGGGTSGLRLLTSSTNGRLEVGTSAQANMNLVLSGARATTGTLATLDFTTTLLKGALRLEDPGAGTNYIALTAPSTPTTHTLTLPAVLPGASAALITDTSGNLSWDTALPTFDGFADPTASVGLSAVNGSATTAMRSDAAPPLSQAIAPTWTGAHTWAGSASTLPIQITQAAAQTENLLRISSSAAVGDSFVRVSSTGEVIFGHNGGTQNDSVRKVVVRGNSTQSASIDLMAIQSETTTISAFDSVGRLKFFNSTGANSTTFDRTAGGSNHTLTWPNAQGAASTYLKNDGAGALSWDALDAADLPAHTHASSSQGGSTLAPTRVYIVGNADEVPFKVTPDATASTRDIAQFIPAGGTDPFAVVRSGGELRSIGGLGISIGTIGSSAAGIFSLDFGGAWTFDKSYVLPYADGNVVLWDTAGLPTAGRLLYGAGATTAMASLGIGSSGMVLTSTGSAPQWSTNAAVVDIARTWSTLQKFPDEQFQILGSAVASRVFEVELDGDATASVTMTLASPHTDNRTVTLPDATTTLVGTTEASTISGVKAFDNSTAPVLQSNIDSGANTTFMTVTDGGTGFTASLKFAAGISANQDLAFPDAAGTVVLTNGVQTINSKSFTGGSKGAANVNKFTVSNKDFYFDPSGNSALIDGNFRTFFTADRNIDFQDTTGQVVMVGNQATASAANNLAEADHVTQSAAIGATNFTWTTAAVGMYQVNFYLECTTADAGEVDTVNFQVSYTDDVGATTKTSNNLGVAATSTGTTAVQDVWTFYVASGGVTYQTNISGSLGATAKYALRARIIYLG